MLSPAYLVLSPAFSNVRLTHAAVGVSQFLRICSAIMFLWSADLYRQTRYLRSPWEKLLYPLAAWFLLAPVAFGEGAVLAPGFLINAVLLAGAASMYVAILVERRMVGAGLTALVLLGFSITNVTAALTSAGAVQTSSDIFLVAKFDRRQKRGDTDALRASSGSRVGRDGGASLAAGAGR